MFLDEHMHQVVERRAVLMVDHISLQWRTAAYCRRTLVPSFHFAREHVDENPLSFLMSRTMRRDLHRRIYARYAHRLKHDRNEFVRYHGFIAYGVGQGWGI
ncbi:hypothetical protein V5799_032158 [Amblyomma americanum]|uniref:Uncharacterized protein n=1 Tax=Amblyomma americanum TaxID=6943 RepID=A0AAQ4DRZ4_AMBAM